MGMLDSLKKGDIADQMLAKNLKAKVDTTIPPKDNAGPPRRVKRDAAEVIDIIKNQQDGDICSTDSAQDNSETAEDDPPTEIAELPPSGGAISQKMTEISLDRLKWTNRRRMANTGLWWYIIAGTFVISSILVLDGPATRAAQNSSFLIWIFVTALGIPLAYMGATVASETKANVNINADMSMPGTDNDDSRDYSRSRSRENTGRRTPSRSSATPPISRGGPPRKSSNPLPSGEYSE